MLRPMTKKIITWRCSWCLNLWTAIFSITFTNIFAKAYQYLPYESRSSYYIFLCILFNTSYILYDVMYLYARIFTFFSPCSVPYAHYISLCMFALQAVMFQLLQGIEYCHRYGVIHRLVSTLFSSELSQILIYIDICL